jgi:diacylglycerol kinase (ATP)
MQEETGQEKTLFVINKRSGRKKNIDRESIIREYVKEHGLDAEFFLMPKKECEKALIDMLDRTRPGTVVAVGGDGTVSLVAEHLLKTGAKMGIVPAGSANGMAKELEIPEDTKAALDIIKKGKSIQSDLVMVNDRWLCMHLSDLGLNARLIKYFEEGPVRGFAGYCLALIKALKRKKNFRTTIQTRNGIKTVEAIMVLFANASKYGTGATINHEGSLTDGYFEVVVVKKIGPAEIWNMFFGKKGFDPAHIEVHQAKSVEVDTTRPSHFQVDGEYLGKMMKIRAVVLDKKLEVFVP